MWQNFAPEAQRVILLGLASAKNMGSAEVDSSHFLPGLIQDPGSLTASILHQSNISLENILQAQKPLAPTEFPIQPQLSSEAKLILEIAHRLACQTPDTPVEPQHIFLAILQSPTSTAGILLVNLGLDLEAARTTVAGAPPPPPPALTDTESRAIRTLAVQFIRHHVASELLQAHSIPVDIQMLALEWARTTREKQLAVTADEYEIATNLREQANRIESTFTERLQEWRNGLI
jgi:ATP-dependent Clp protease ATP-binding subunit ClpA